MITFTQNTTQIKCKPENAAKYRAAMEKATKAKTKNEAVKRSYPVFTPGMSTARYVQIFNAQFEGAQHKIKHDCTNYYSNAAMLDPIQPEVLEELDADWTPPAPKVKKGKARAVHLIQCVRDDLLFYMGNPAEFDAEYFHDLLRCADEALENLK